MRIQWFYLAVLLVGLAGCATAAPSPSPTGSNGTSPLEGRILVWHGWVEGEAAVLESQINTFRRLHPDVTIAVVQVAPADILARYSEAAQLGLGPDLLVGKSEWLGNLVAAQAVRDISAEVNPAGRYVPSALERLQDRGQLYGLPLSLRPPALYYNRTLVTTPATTLEELLQQATDGQVVALSTNAQSGYWGMAAFGPPLFDSNGTLTADTSGLVGWLNWLKRAQDNPNVILSQDETSLEQLFAEGRASYYVGSVDLLAGFQAALEGETGENVVGVAPLPAGTSNPRPLVEVDALYFNGASSERQYALARSLADFLTNAEQGNVLLRELGRVPANQRVRVISRLYPAVAVFAQQGRLAVSIPHPLRPLILGEAGNGLYTAVLAGARTTEGAICEYSKSIRQTLQTDPETLPTCPE